jgi:hypothetical protein
MQIAIRDEEQHPPTPYCTKCGAPNIERCEHCNSALKERRAFERPSYCGDCGKPHPWTAIALATANEYADELEGLSNDDKMILKGTFIDLTVDSPRTALAASRFKRIVKMVTPTAKDILTKIVVEFATQAAKTALGG